MGGDDALSPDYAAARAGRTPPRRKPTKRSRLAAAAQAAPLSAAGQEHAAYLQKRRAAAALAPAKAKAKARRAKQTARRAVGIGALEFGAPRKASTAHGFAEPAELVDSAMRSSAPRG